MKQIAFLRAQDWEMNLRIRRTGGRVWFQPKLRVSYRPRSTVRALGRLRLALWWETITHPGGWRFFHPSRWRRRRRPQAGRRRRRSRRRSLRSSTLGKRSSAFFMPDRTRRAAVEAAPARTAAVGDAIAGIRDDAHDAGSHRRGRGKCRQGLDVGNYFGPAQPLDVPSGS